MRQASERIPESAEKTVRDIRRATRRHYSAEEKIRIVLEGLRGEDSIAELCRKEGINQNLYYRWSKEFLEAGKKRLAGDAAREGTSDEVKELKAEARQLKETLASKRLPPSEQKRGRHAGGLFSMCSEIHKRRPWEARQDAPRDRPSGRVQPRMPSVPIRGLDPVGPVVLRAGSKSEGAAGRFHSNAADRFIWVVDELIKPNARFWTYAEIGVVVKSQTRHTTVSGVNQLLRINGATV
jgi:transposase